MKKLLLLSLLGMLCISLAFAQEEKPIEESFRQDIGFNTIFILQGIFQSGNAPFSLMYKKYTSENHAIRFGADVFFNLDDNDANSSPSYYSNSSAASVAFVIGKEFQKPIEKRWTWYYGGDLVPFFSFNNQDYFQNGSLYSESEYSSIGLNVRPFLGIRFNINPQLYLSAEANIALRYARTRNYQIYTNNDQPERGINGNNLSFSLNPASGLFLFYRF